MLALNAIISIKSRDTEIKKMYVPDIITTFLAANVFDDMLKSSLNTKKYDNCTNKVEM